jgi:alkylated DNA repair dioxygenase AlkB
MDNGISLINGSRLKDNIISNTDVIFDNLMKLDYDKTMTSRWTVSFGRSYNYSNMNYPDTDIPDFLLDIIDRLSPYIGFVPNNCLINLYQNGDSKMGYHSDITDILYPNTGVIIVSIGATRTLRFKNKFDNSNIIDYTLSDGSVFYMNIDVQDNWVHSIPKCDSDDIRISLTFRKIK